MKKSEWNEERLKALLSQLPTVKDNRSANQIYQKLILAPKRKSPKKRVGAFAATVLVLFLLMLITPQLIEQIRSQNSADANISSDGKLVQTEADAAKSEP
ncbi:RsiX protein, partial [Bacillus licheniformis]|nr:RsiX protein [Bacillus licheniformis]